MLTERNEEKTTNQRHKHAGFAAEADARLRLQQVTQQVSQHTGPTYAVTAVYNGVGKDNLGDLWYCDGPSSMPVTVPPLPGTLSLFSACPLLTHGCGTNCVRAVHATLAPQSKLHNLLKKHGREAVKKLTRVDVPVEVEITQVLAQVPCDVPCIPKLRVVSTHEPAVWMILGLPSDGTCSATTPRLHVAFQKSLHMSELPAAFHSSASAGLCALRGTCASLVWNFLVRWFC